MNYDWDWVQRNDTIPFHDPYGAYREEYELIVTTTPAPTVHHSIETTTPADLMIIMIS
jgi:hypothetical protein